MTSGTQAVELLVQPAGPVRDPEAIDPLPCGGESHPVPRLARPDAQGDRQVRFSGSWRDGDTLQHLRATLPAEVRVTATAHPLFGRLLHASGFKRWDGVLLLLVTLPDGSPGTVRADATDVLGKLSAESASFVLTAEGIRRLQRLTTATAADASKAERRQGKQIGSPDPVRANELGGEPLCGSSG
jgi:hypothetical protein